MALRVAPESRIVYVDKDPLVIAHARALLASTPPGTTDYIDADLYQPDTILEIAREKLDFTQPVAIMLMGILGHVGNPGENDDEVAQSIVGRLKAAAARRVPPPTGRSPAPRWPAAGARGRG